jgi:ankyrin repeat protein
MVAGAEVDSSISEDQQRPIHAACAGGHVSAVELLCQWDAKVDLRCSNGMSPLQYAESAECAEDIISILVLKLERDLQA